MRWHHPVVGEIPPDVSINLAEAQQMTVPLTHHPLVLTASDGQVPKRILPRGVKLGLNTSPAYLQADSFRDDILCSAAALPTDHFHVMLEVTERAVIDKEKSITNSAWLHQQGFEIITDDSGTGHSTLIYLERYSFDYLKIDHDFVRVIDTETVTLLMLGMILTFSRRPKLMTVTEGVETQGQAEWSCAQGVSFLQGYQVSHPLSLEALVATHDESASYFVIR